MTAPSSIDPARFLHDQLESASPDLLRPMLATFINALMSAEADAVCGAPYGMPGPDRVNVRNGYRHRDFDTRAGTLDVAIPKLRSGRYFPDWLLERRRRAEAALTVGGGDLLPARGLHAADGEAGGVPRDHPAVASRRSARWPGIWMRRWRRSGPGRWTPGPTRSSPRTRWCSRSARAAGSSTCMPCWPPASTPTGTGRSSACRSPRAEDGAGWLAFFRDLTARGLTGVAAGHLRRPPRPDRGDRRHPARRGLAAVPHPLRREPDGRHPEGVLAVGQDAAALGL